MNTTTFTSMLGATIPAWIPAVGFTFLVLALWSVLWKGLALWHAGRRGQEKWFIVLLIINTAGILELIYLFGVLKLKFADLFSK